MLFPASHAGKRGSIPLGATKLISNTVQYSKQVLCLQHITIDLVSYGGYNGFMQSGDLLG